MRTASRLGVYALGVVGAFGLAAAAGAILGPIDVDASATHSSMPPANIPDPTTSVEIDGYTVSMSGDRVVGASMLMFDVLLGGQSVTTDPFLGGTGHLVIVRTDDLGYLRTYPIDGTSGSSIQSYREAV